jgi:glycosyltransferase involved in cell wall biosynthesis
MSTNKQIVMLLAETYVRDTRPKIEAESLLSAGHKVIVLSWDRSGGQPREAVHRGIRVVSFQVLSGKTFSKAKFALAAILFQVICYFWALKNLKGPYAIHVHDFNALGAGALLRATYPRTTKLVYDSHEWTLGAYSEWYSSAIGAIATAVEMKLIAFADVVITVSPPIANYLATITKSPVFVIYNTINRETVPQLDKETAKRELGLDGFVVSFVGIIRQDAAFDELIEAARRFRDKHVTGITFLIVGDGPEIGRIKQNAADLNGSVKFVPFLPRALALKYVRASDLTYAVYRNLGENTRVAMPWKLFESMACGTPVLVREGTYTWTFVSQLGIGLSVGSGTADEVSHAILLAFEQPERSREMSNRARASFLKDYNWNRMAEMLASIYSSLGW